MVCFDCEGDVSHRKLICYIEETSAIVAQTRRYRSLIAIVDLSQHVVHVLEFHHGFSFSVMDS